jgi:hypothetical protein
MASISSIAWPLASAFIQVGRTGDAVRVLERAEIVQRGRPHIGQARIAAAMGMALLRLGRMTEAVVAAKEALDLARQRLERGIEAYALQLWGEIHGTPPEPNVSGALVSYAQVIDLATECGMRPLVAHCHLSLGKLHRCTGNCEQAREHITTAMTLYLAMGMTHWLEQAESEMRR